MAKRKKIKIEKIKQIVEKNKGGFSVYLNNLKEVKTDKNLYCVAITDNRNINLNVGIKNILKASNCFKQIKNKLVLGGWFDTDSLNYCLDLVVLESNKENALYLAKMFNQKAIFNLLDYTELKNKEYKKQ